MTELLDSLRAHAPAIDDDFLDRARALDKLYIPTRYPNGLAAGAPADFYTRPEAQRAIADAVGGPCGLSKSAARGPWGASRLAVLIVGRTVISFIPPRHRPLLTRPRR